jgi:hypothetical protein
MLTSTPSPMPSSHQDEPDPDELFTRQLCPDGSCIGVLDTSLTCPECGAVAEESAQPEAPGEPSGVDLLHRSLCPDGACIGILGSDGRCKECGHVGTEVTTDPRLRGLQDEDEDEDDPVSVSSKTAAHTSRPAQGGLSGAKQEDEQADSLADEPLPAEFASRHLCPDGSCIGLVGAAGTCNECGLVA